jgi:hypothetical protein
MSLQLGRLTEMQPAALAPPPPDEPPDDGRTQRPD